MKKAFLALGIVLAFGVVLVGFLLVSNKVDVMDNKVYYYVGTRDVDLTDETMLPEHGIESNKGVPPIFVEDISIELLLEEADSGSYNDLRYTLKNNSDKNIISCHITYKLLDGESYTIGDGFGEDKILKPGNSYEGKMPLKKGYTLESLIPSKMMLDIGVDGKEVTFNYDYNTQFYEWIV